MSKLYVGFAALVVHLSVVAAPCPPIDPAALWLPADKAEAKADFTAKAARLNASGKCVIEGSFGRDSQKFYFAVRDGNVGAPYHLRFTRDELRK